MIKDRLRYVPQLSCVHVYNYLSTRRRTSRESRYTVRPPTEVIAAKVRDEISLRSVYNTYMNIFIHGIILRGKETLYYNVTSEIITSTSSYINSWAPRKLTLLHIRDTWSVNKIATKPTCSLNPQTFLYLWPSNKYSTPRQTILFCVFSLRKKIIRNLGRTQQFI